MVEFSSWSSVLLWGSYYFWFITFSIALTSSCKLLSNYSLRRISFLLKLVLIWEWSDPKSLCEPPRRILPVGPGWSKIDVWRVAVPLDGGQLIWSTPSWFDKDVWLGYLNGCCIISGSKVAQSNRLGRRLRLTSLPTSTKPSSRGDTKEWVSLSIRESLLARYIKSGWIV